MIRRFDLEITGLQAISLPPGAVILSVADQSCNLCLWAMATNWTGPADDYVVRQIEITETGRPIPAGRLTFIGTAIISSHAWHVFERHQYFQTSATHIVDRL